MLPRSKVLCLCSLSLLWGLVTTFIPPPLGANSYSTNDCAGPDFEQGMLVCICPRDTICAKNTMSVVFLVLAKGSAYFDYPLYILLFLSKANNLRGVPLFFSS
jgi:hypothetical protein